MKQRELLIRIGITALCGAGLSLAAATYPGYKFEDK